MPGHTVPFLFRECHAIGKGCSLKRALVNSNVVSERMHIQPGLVYISHKKGKKPLLIYLTPPESVQVLVAFVLDLVP